MNLSIYEYVPGQIWLKEYPVSFYGCRFNSRMSVVRIGDSSIMLHSPSEIDNETKKFIGNLGEVTSIVAPGNYHYLHVDSAQKAFPDAETWICPGIERKKHDLRFNWFLADSAPSAWDEQMEQVLIRGTRFMREVAFYHRASRTLILVDLIENFDDNTPGTNLMLKFWMKYVFGMWGRPMPGPEYRLGWGNTDAVRECMERILEWDFERVIMAHGELIEQNAREIVKRAWQGVLE